MFRILVFAFLSICAAYSQAERHTTRYHADTPSYALSQDAAPKGNKDEEIAYITTTGAKYRAAGCRHLKKSSIPIELSKAKSW